MASRVASFEWKSPGRQVNYPWGIWDDGSVWRAREGQDFSCSPTGFAQSVYRYAHRVGKKARVSIDDMTVTFQIVETQ